MGILNAIILFATFCTGLKNILEFQFLEEMIYYINPSEFLKNREVIKWPTQE